MTEHAVVESSGRDGGSVSCRRCSREAVVDRRHTSVNWRPDEFLMIAWNEFLRGVPWDCDAAIVESVMRR